MTETMLSGPTLTGTVPTGTVPTGTVPTGTVPTGTVPTGTVPTDEVDGRRRDRKKRQTRTALVEAAADLFASRGFDEITTVDIAEAADVSQRTLFRHFPTKEALLYGDMDDLYDRLRWAFADRPADEPIVDVVRHAMSSIAADFDLHRVRRLLQVRLAAATPSVSAYSRSVLQASWEREVIRAVAARLDVDPIDDPRPEILAGAAMSAIRVATRQWSRSDGEVPFADLADRALAAIGALSPPS